MSDPYWYEQERFLQKRIEGLEMTVEAYKAEVARLTAERDGLANALRNLVKMNVEHNEAVEAVIGRSVNWSDNYLDEARAALAALPAPPEG